MSDLPSPKKHKTSNWSAIWVLPLVALAIGAWLALACLRPGRGADPGALREQRWHPGEEDRGAVQGHLGRQGDRLDVSEDIKGVVATIEINKEARQYLSKGTRFWLVKPRVSLAGVTGLEPWYPASTSRSIR